MTYSVYRRKVCGWFKGLRSLILRRSPSPSN